MNALEIRNLTKNYNGFSLGPINLVLPSGCIMGFIGDGVGKLLERTLAGSGIPPAEAKVRADSANVRCWREEARYCRRKSPISTAVSGLTIGVWAVR